MRSTTIVEPPAVQDLTARARIRDAAIARFGREGFGVALRAIARDAGVSPGLVVHHFGSKDGLRAACDAHVLRVIRAHKEQVVRTSGPDLLLVQLARIEELAPLLQYALTSLAAGGPFARQLVEQMVDDAVEYLVLGESEGTIRPSRDPRARARFLVLQALGAVLLHLRLQPEPLVGADLVRSVADVITLPALELFTHGLLTDSRYLDAYLAQWPGEGDRR